MAIVLDGERLTIAEVRQAAGGVEAALAPEAVSRMRRSREVVERLAAGDDPVYALNTGVGMLADVRIPREDLERLQVNIVRSHAAGVGEPLAREVVRGILLIRANVLAKGLSGIRPVVAERLCDLLNRGVTPVVPSRGSVGASGDLAPLAHVALVLIGEGEAEYGGEILPGGEALRRARHRAAHASGQGRHFADQRHAGHAGGGVPGGGSGGDAGGGGRRGVRHDARRAARHPARLRPAHPRRAPAPRAGGKRGEACGGCSRAARSAPRTWPAGACRTPIRCAARRRRTAPCATRCARPGASSRWN